MAILEENDILFAHKALTLMPGLTDATRRVAGAIIDHFNKRTGQCDPGIERLATLLGVSRPSVIRATNQLNELGLIERISHGGKSHRSSYLPNWELLRAVVQDWDARMKTGEGPSACAPETVTPKSEMAAPKVSRMIPLRYHPCDLKGIIPDTQTLRSNQSNKPIEGAIGATARANPPPQAVLTGQNGLLKGHKARAQRSLLLPINGGRTIGRADAARAAAERRLNQAAAALGERAYVEIIEWMTIDRQKSATDAEFARRGGGIAFIMAAMQDEAGLLVTKARHG